MLRSISPGHACAEENWRQRMFWARNPTGLTTRQVCTLASIDWRIARIRRTSHAS